MNYSVVIPTLNEAEKLPQCIASIGVGQREAEVIVADGGSVDETVETARSLGVAVVTGSRGRGTQMNGGASVARGKILMFLHADTILPPDAFTVVDRTMADPHTDVAAFRARFVPETPLLRIYSALTRFDSPVTTFGDQCLVVRSSFFHSIGGFPDWPLFEDVEFLRRARREVSVKKMESWVSTSSRKFLVNGTARQQVRNGMAMFRFLRGESPHVLAAEYYRQGEAPKGAKRKVVNERPIVVGQEQ